MCGIILIITRNYKSEINLLELFQIFREVISRRGPNSLGIELFTTKDNIQLLFAATVLWLQGEQITKQPVINKTSILIYNGDIFQGIPEECKYQIGDTKYIFDLLNGVEPSEVHEKLYELQGPYALIFYDKLKNNIYFGRDKFGRRSMLIGKGRNSIILTSVAKRNSDFNFMELPSVGTFIWNLISNDIVLYPFSNNNYSHKKIIELEEFLEQKIHIVSTPTISSLQFRYPNAEQFSILESIIGKSGEEVFQILLSNNEWLSKVTHLHSLLKDSVARRILGQPKFCAMCINDKIHCSHSSLGVLFSGGVDCSILTLLCNEFVNKDKPIDLFNVAFDAINGFKTPDRLTGLETLQELKQLCPNRQWRFKELNISKKKLDEKRDECIADLIHPLKTVLDDSLGCALWFASRGDDDSHCRVLFVGMGADELFGGYTKHRAAFKRESWLGLHNTLVEDWDNLPYRNLARDDRVVSDHGKQLRTPYLDENLVNFVHNLQCWERSYPSEKVPQGLGDKILLRSLAYHLGLRKAAFLKKRALQFGSRIANNKEVAHEISSRLG
ncbi:asparagine synthetase domain-containing protein CG17486 isoform X1 [Diorhabda sublineata]|uniref:asparagine synthetase domain-containing protein CG17486 isoform X1 n=1 Tax=Diorhabda sublineata TaxID=1163346 RepID=UPI0024E16D7B|nr:asparagine synthetase domain-containing protein CG17486 isoform X1 [Diorhabda sublineata]